MKDLYYFVAHLDDFEISCIGYLYKNYKQYDNVKIVISTDWKLKRDIWYNNLNDIRKFFNLPNIQYVNLDYPQRRLMSEFDNLKDDFYKEVAFNQSFDIVTHDCEDCHTDHIACNMIAKGLYKYSNNFTTIYSPSSKNFKANYWISLPKDVFNLKKICFDKYNIDNEESYTKLGYYMNNDDHYNIGKTYFLESFAKPESDHFEVYRILKRLE